MVLKASRCVGIARLGADDQQIVAGTVEEILNVDFGGPLHSLVMVGETHVMEDDILRFLCVSNQDINQRE